MAKQTFTAGQVLTATQMNNLQANDYNWTTSAQTSSYVLVAANAGQTVTMTSAAATTITVNTGLFAAGDTVRILNLGAGATTITAGTATVNTAGSLVVPQYGSGTLWFSSASAAIFIPDDVNTGLRYLTGATFTAASTITVDNVFSSTYTNYLIVMRYVTSGTQTINAVFRASGVDATSNYNSQRQIIDNTTQTIDRQLAQSSFVFAKDSNGTFPSLSICNLSGVNLAEATAFAINNSLMQSAFNAPDIINYYGNHSTTTAYDGIKWTLAAATTATGSYAIYGYTK